MILIGSTSKKYVYFVTLVINKLLLIILFVNLKLNISVNNK